MTDKESFSKEIDSGFGLVAISNYLEYNNNYIIYHTVNDYLINKTQLKQLKRMSGNKLFILNNGSHMGFLYRPEFIIHLKNTIANINNL